MPHFRIRPLAAFAFVIALSARPAAVLAGNNSQVPLPVAPVFSLLEACPTESPSLGSRQAPGDAAYADFVRATSHTFGGRLDPDLRARLDKMLSSSERPGLANEIGVMLAAQRSIFAAVYVLAKGAQGSPRDAVLANDLGVALKGLGDYGEAAQALLYAGRIAPDRPVILTNLGFLAIAMRDGSYAQSALNRAIKADPSEPHALAGLAMLAECRKDHAEAAKMFRESLRVEFFPMAAVGMQAALSSMTSEEIDQDGQEAGALSRPASPAAGRVLNVPPPPIGPAWADVGPSYDRVKDYDADNQRRIHQLAFQFQEERQRAAHEAGESFSSGVMLLERWPDKQLFALGNLARTCTQRLQDLSEIYHREAEGILSASGARSSGFRQQWRVEQQREEQIVVERNRESAGCGRDNECRASVGRKYAPRIADARAQVCKPQAAAGAAAYSRLYPAWKNYWSHGAQEIQAYYARSEPYLRQLDPQWAAAANTWREISIRTELGNLLVDSIDPLWNARDALVADFMSTEYQVYCPQPAAKKSATAQPSLSIAPEPPNPACRSRWEVSLGVARMRADCRKLSFAYEAGPLSDLIGKSVLGWVHDSLTIIANPHAGPNDVLGAGTWRNYVTIGEHYFDCGSTSGVRLVLDPASRSANLPSQMTMVSDIPMAIDTPLKYMPLPEIP